MGQKRWSKGITVLLVVISILLSFPIAALGDVWEFGSSGDGGNPFMPRGYIIETDSSKYWLRSRYDNSGQNTLYSGSYNGIEYVSATPSSGTAYRFYAMTDRNPLNYRFLLAYKNGVKIADFTSFLGSPGRLAGSETLGSGARWAIPINGFTLEPGSLYEFAFQRGLQANNGTSLVLSADGRGYLKNPFTTSEWLHYESQKHTEYEFIANYEAVLGGAKPSFVPMRFTLQTYADLSVWESAALEAQSFIDSVTPHDYEAGTYDRDNIEALTRLLAQLNTKAEDTVKFELQAKADTSIQKMINQLHEALSLAKMPKEYADLTELNAKLQEATELYLETKDNIGGQIGQYGAAEVSALKAEIDESSLLTKDDTQVEVDAAVKSLTDVMTLVHASRVKEEMIVLVDKATGLKIVASTAALPRDATLFVRVMDETTEEYKAYIEELGKGTSNIRLFDVRLYSGTERIQPTIDVEVHIPIDNIKFAGVSTSIHSVETDGSYKKISSASYEGYRVIDSDSISFFSVVGGKTTSNQNGTGDADGKGDGQTKGKGDKEGDGTIPNQDKLNNSENKNSSINSVNETDIPLDEEADAEDALSEVEAHKQEVAIESLGEVFNREMPEAAPVPLNELYRGQNPMPVLVYAGCMFSVAMGMYVNEKFKIAQGKSYR